MILNCRLAHLRLLLLAVNRITSSISVASHGARTTAAACTIDTQGAQDSPCARHSQMSNEKSDGMCPRVPQPREGRRTIGCSCAALQCVRCISSCTASSNTAPQPSASFNAHKDEDSLLQRIHSLSQRVNSTGMYEVVLPWRPSAVQHAS